MKKEQKELIKENIIAVATKQVQEYKREYIIETSGKTSISCTEDELQKIAKAAETGSFAWLRNGMINPSHIVSITLDRKKMAEFRNKIDKWVKDSTWVAEYGDGKIKQLEIYKPEKSIFEGVKLVSDGLLLDKSKLMK